MRPLFDDSQATSPAHPADVLGRCQQTSPSRSVTGHAATLPPKSLQLFKKQKKSRLISKKKTKADRLSGEQAALDGAQPAQDCVLPPPRSDPRQRYRGFTPSRRFSASSL